MLSWALWMTSSFLALPEGVGGCGREEACSSSPGARRQLQHILRGSAPPPSGSGEVGVLLPRAAPQGLCSLPLSESAVGGRGWVHVAQGSQQTMSSPGPPSACMS